MVRKRFFNTLSPLEFDEDGRTTDLPLSMKSHASTRQTGRNLTANRPMRLEERGLRTAVFVESINGSLSKIESRLLREEPDVLIRYAHNWIEGCLLIGRIKPDIVCLSTEMDDGDVIALINRLLDGDRSQCPIVILATSRPDHDPLIAEAVALGVNAVIPIAPERQTFLEPMVTAISEPQTQSLFLLNREELASPIPIPSPTPTPLPS